MLRIRIRLDPDVTNGLYRKLSSKVKRIINIGAGRIVFCLKFFNDSLSFRKIKFELFKDFEENKIQFFVKKFLSLL